MFAFLDLDEVVSSEAKINVSAFSRLADLQLLENSPELESSPELSESFELYLQQRKLKVESEKAKMMKGESPRSSKIGPHRPPLASGPSRMSNMINNTTINGADDTLMQCSDDSFLAMEKMCENTLHLNNVSDLHFMDLTTMASPSGKQRGGNSSKLGDETRLNDIEAPTFMFNNTSLLGASPIKGSPVFAAHQNRPSTILEVSEVGSSFRTNLSSYRTALTRSGTEASEYFKTADEGSFSPSRTIEDEMMIKMPKLRSFYAAPEDLTKDSLDSTAKADAGEMTCDSLNPNSYAGESSSGVESSFDQTAEEVDDAQMNDTLERIEFMLAQAQKIQEQERAPTVIPASPTVAYKSPAPAQLRLQPKAPESAAKNSPLIKFSPAFKPSPSNADSGFKRPAHALSKIPTPFANNKKFQHIVSPVQCYIKRTPGAPMAATARVLHGINNSPKHFNFRDSESFAKENESMNAEPYKGSSLPFRAKTKSSAVSQVRICAISKNFLNSNFLLSDLRSA